MSSSAPTDLRGTSMNAETFWERVGPDSRYELIEGEVREVAPAGGEHGRIEARLTARLQMWVEERGEGIVVAGEVGYQLGDHLVRGADIAVHLSDVDPPERGWMTAMPDLVVEIASPNDSYVELERKVVQYLDAGVTEVWIVDPSNRTVLQRRSETHRLVRGDAALASDLLPGFESTLEAVFGRGHASTT